MKYVCVVTFTLFSVNSIIYRRIIVAYKFKILKWNESLYTYKERWFVCNGDCDKPTSKSIYVYVIAYNFSIVWLERLLID